MLLPDISLETFNTHYTRYPTMSTSQILSNNHTMAIEQHNDIILQQLEQKLLKEEEYFETIFRQDYC